MIFDLDNTLIKSRQGANRALQTVAGIITDQLGNNGHPYSRSVLFRKLRAIERNKRAPNSGLVSRRIYDRDKWWMMLLQEVGLSRLGGAWVHKATMSYWDAYMGASPPFSDAAPTLKRLKRAGLKLGVVSDSDGTPGIKRLRVWKLPFRTLFDTVVVAGEDTRNVKPSRTPFVLAARHLGLSPSECAYVGDNSTTDIEGAKAVGMATFLVRRRKYMVIRGLRAGRPTYEVGSLGEIPGLLSELS